MKYTYSDDEGGSDAFSTRRSNRNSGISTPAEPNGPTFTASGRQVRSRHGGAYGESMLSGHADPTEIHAISGVDGADEDEEEGPISRGRPRRAAQQNGVRPKPRARKHIEGYNSLDSMDDESDAAYSGGWDGGDDESEDHAEDEEEEEEEEDDDDDDGDIEMSDMEEIDIDEEEDKVQQSLVVSLRYMKSHSSPPTEETQGDTALAKDHSSQPSLLSTMDMSLLSRPPSTQETQYENCNSKNQSQSLSMPSDGSHPSSGQSRRHPSKFSDHAPAPPISCPPTASSVQVYIPPRNEQQK